MEIEVGDYVRTVDGVIAKVITIRSSYKTKIYHFDNTLYQDWDEDIDYLRDSNLEKNIVKHSKNIIDLIEVGDIVTIILNESTNETTKFCFESQKQIDILKESECHPIKSIITKEQFESVEYKVGE